MLKSIIFSLLFLVIQSSFSQTDSLFCQQIKAITGIVKQQHYQPKTINDSLSKGVFNLFLKAIDPDKDFLLATDITALKSDVLLFDDYLNSENCNFVLKYKTLLEQRILDTKTILEDLKTTKIDYSGSLTLQYTPDKYQTYFKNNERLKIGLTKRVAYKVIAKLADQYPDITDLKANFLALEDTTKQDIIKNELCLLSELSNTTGGIQRFVEEAFLNAFLHYHDPHSVFFNPTEKLIYEDGLSSNQLSFGIVTDKNNEGKIVIDHVVPGSSAFNNGNFEDGDTILSLTANQNTLEVTCVSNEEIQEFLNKEDNTTILFSLKKKNGTVQNITISKSKIKVEDNAIRGYLIGEESNLGYIKIPSFYTNDETLNGRGLTADFAKELYKLQKQNIQGLVIDLRFNGGGSMQEAIELTGMFIDREPVIIVEYNTNETVTIKDYKRGTFFDKPIIVLVNNFSASASELFASAMQDYNRAIIVGAKTHGKSSAQTILPLDPNNSIGFCKITVEKFYRVTGQTHQAQGVIPDVILPSIYDDLESGEAFYNYALQPTNVEVKLAHRPLTINNLEQIKANTKKRLDANIKFNAIKENNKKLKNTIFTKGEKYTLTLDNVINRRQEKEVLYNSIFSSNTDSLLKVTNTNSTQELLTYNDDEKVLNDAILKNISEDLYISETFNILQDLIKLNN
ncbi:carboxy terminal-processing peptidase [Olleya sp. R77988]|uniref:carboxy terminal-processing peptidase n=1 Tax=Olleya sp. R77988 TaxID=3093875 RepID=UPI0037C76A15